MLLLYNWWYFSVSVYERWSTKCTHIHTPDDLELRPGIARILYRKLCGQHKNAYRILYKKLNQKMNVF